MYRVVLVEPQNFRGFHKEMKLSKKLYPEHMYRYAAIRKEVLESNPADIDPLTHGWTSLSGSTSLDTKSYCQRC